MRKKIFGLLLVSVMVSSITACGGKETEESNSTPSQQTVTQSVEENVSDEKQVESVEQNADVAENTNEVGEVIEGDAPIDETVDSGLSGNETIDLTNTTMINIGEQAGFNIEVPVFTFAYSEVKAGALGNTVAYLANNSEGDYYYEAYSLVIVPEKTGTSPADSLARFEKYKADEETKGYEYVDIIGDADSKYILYCRVGQKSPNGTILCVRDDYYIYDSTTCNTYKVTLRVNKDSALYGEDVLEKSTATYREELCNTIKAFVNN